MKYAMERKKISFIIFIVVTLGFLSWSTWHVANLIIWKPPLETRHVPIVISYPDSMFRPFYGENASICTVKFLLEYQGTLTENIPVKIINASCTSYVPYNLTISVGIPQAIRYELKETIGDNETMVMDWGGTDILTFYDNYNPIVDSPFEPLVNYHMIYPSSQEEIYFPVAGDYSPIILLSESGIAEYDPIIYRYDQIRIHVASETEVESLNIDKVNLGFTVALFVFSWIGYFVLVYELIGKVFKKKDADQIAININIIPDANKVIPISKTEETNNLSKSPKPDTSKRENKEKTTNKKPSHNNTSPT
jgi:hypothetical protein